jgi:hypothetical protein
MRIFGLGCLTHVLCYHGIAATFTEASHEIHSSINDSPTQITTERSKKHCPNLKMIRCYHADYARDR